MNKKLRTGSQGPGCHSKLKKTETPPPLQKSNALDIGPCGPEILNKQNRPYFLFLDCIWKSQVPQSKETISPGRNMEGLKSKATENVINLMD